MLSPRIVVLLFPLAAFVALPLVPRSAQTDTFPCTEPGIVAAIAAGGGPHTFDCPGPTTVTTTARITIDNDVILDGEGDLTVDGNDAHPVFFVDAGIAAELWNLTVSGGSSSGAGGILNAGTLLLSNSNISGNNVTGLGGGIWNGIAGRLTLANSTVSENRASRGGGIYSNGPSLTLTDSAVFGNQGGRGSTPNAGGGGGIYLERGTLTISNSAISDNYVSDGWGAGIRSQSGTVRLVDTTLSDNIVVGGSALGGGIYNQSATLTLTNTTLSGNFAADGGDAINNASGTLTLVSCTLRKEEFGSPAADIRNFADLTIANTLLDGNCSGSGSFTSDGGNLESPANTCGLADPSDQVNVASEDLKLGPLQDNGGPTLTHAPLYESLAIDAIPVEDCVDAEGMPLLTDQRGVERPQGPRCDTGAVEVVPEPSTTVLGLASLTALCRLRSRCRGVLFQQ